MAKWLLIIVLLGAGGWFGYTKWRDHRAQKVAGVLVEVVCQTTLVKEGHAVYQEANAAKQRGALLAKRAELLAKTRAFMQRLDQEIDKRGGKPADLKVLFRGGPMDLATTALRVSERAHEACPAVYNARPTEIPQLIAMIAVAAVNP